MCYNDSIPKRKFSQKKKGIRIMELKGKKINFLGDSITEGHGVSNPANFFENRLLVTEGLAAARNYGIGGTRIAKQNQPTEPQWDRYFASRVDEMDPDADIIVVFGGTNDYGHGDAPIGKFEDRTPDTFYGALHVLYRKLFEKYSDSLIVVMTPTHRLNEFSPRGDGFKEPTLPLAGYVQIIKEVANYYSLPVLDLFACSGFNPDVPILREKYIPDGLHPNDEGHRLIAERLAGFLKTL